MLSFFLIHLELKQQKRSNSPTVPSKTIPDSRPTCKRSRRFQTETTQIPYPLGRHIPIWITVVMHCFRVASSDYRELSHVSEKKSTLFECQGI